MPMGSPGSLISASDAVGSYTESQAARDLFWHNVMRQILMSLSMQSLRQSTKKSPDGEPPPGSELFDGRLAVLTHAGERIPIAMVHPVLACGIDTSDHTRSLSMAVECTVFQVRTPNGEVYTLPLHEMRGFHALSPELMKQIEEASHQMERGHEEGSEPFGFAAFTSLAGPNTEQKTPPTGS